MVANARATFLPHRRLNTRAHVGQMVRCIGGIVLEMMLCVMNELHGSFNDWFDFYGLLNVRIYAVCASKYRNAKTNPR